jgi:hypothetical protein
MHFKTGKKLITPKRMTHEEQVAETQSMIKEQLKLLKKKVVADSAGDDCNFSGSGGPSFINHTMKTQKPAHHLYSTLMAMQEQFNNELA